MDFKDELEYISPLIQKNIEKKQVCPYEKVIIENLSFNKLENLVEQLKEKKEVYSEKIISINIILNDVKLKSNDVSIDLEIEKYKIERNKYSLLYKRHELNSEISSIHDIEIEVIKNIALIKEMEKELSEMNIDFAAKYFKIVGGIFSKLDTRGLYTIEPYEDTKGYQPIFGFKLKYNSIEVVEKNIKLVLSDGDKRALALSVYLAKIIYDNNFGKSILILDDPVISLDEERSEKIIQLMTRLFEKNILQIIILTHNPQFVKRISKASQKIIFDSSSGIKIELLPEPLLLKLIWSLNGTTVERIEDLQIEFDEYVKTYSKIQNFINGNHEDPLFMINLIRPFLEDEISWRFRNTLYSKKFDGVGGKVDFLFNERLLSNDLYKKLKEQIHTLNPSHHHIDYQNEEIVRGIAKDIMETVYFDLNSFDMKNSII